jgi:Asp-tRNA(Asn)/Glu-tRNA(Gln) amidotransferase A subunit family amidase
MCSNFGRIKENYGCHFYSKSVNVMRDVRAAYDALFREYDVIIMPTIKTKAHLLPNKEATVIGIRSSFDLHRFFRFLHNMIAWVFFDR